MLYRASKGYCHSFTMKFTISASWMNSTCFFSKTINVKKYIAWFLIQAQQSDELERSCKKHALLACHKMRKNIPCIIERLHFPIGKDQNISFCNLVWMITIMTRVFSNYTFNWYDMCKPFVPICASCKFHYLVKSFIISIFNLLQFYYWIRKILHFIIPLQHYKYKFFQYT